MILMLDVIVVLVGFLGWHQIQLVLACNKSVTDNVNGSLDSILECRVGLRPDLLLPDVLFQRQRIGNRDYWSDFSNEWISGPANGSSLSVDEVEHRVGGQLQDGQRESGHLEAGHESAGKDPFNFDGIVFGQLSDRLVDEDPHFKVGDRAQVVDQYDHVITLRNSQSENTQFL